MSYFLSSGAYCYYMCYFNYLSELKIGSSHPSLELFKVFLIAKEIASQSLKCPALYDFSPHSHMPSLLTALTMPCTSLLQAARLDRNSFLLLSYSERKC